MRKEDGVRGEDGVKGEYGERGDAVGGSIGFRGRMG